MRYCPHCHRHIADAGSLETCDRWTDPPPLPTIDEAMRAAETAQTARRHSAQAWQIMAARLEAGAATADDLATVEVVAMCEWARAEAKGRNYGRAPEALLECCEVCLIDMDDCADHVDQWYEERSAANALRIASLFAGDDLTSRDLCAAKEEQ